MRVLIPTYLDDVHAVAVACVLRLQGHEVTLWHGADYPTLQDVSISVSREAGFNWSLSGPALDCSDQLFDVVWYRRPTPPVLPDNINSADREIAERQCREMYKAIWQLLASDAFWVNPIASRDRANAKPVQLQEARRIGLNIPSTLFSNDPEKIRAFLRSHRDAIYKPFVPTQWKTEDGSALLFTSEITLDDLPDDDVLRLSPGIFQEKISKDHELRVTYMGHHAVTVKLLSQENPAANLDWRAAFSNVKVERAELPEEVDHRCRLLMKSLGIVFGCFDFIVTPEGEYVFLEVNEMGQFLWIEVINPEIELLAPFCDFITSRQPCFSWERSAHALRYADLYKDVSRQLKEDSRLHVKRPFYELADERVQLASADEQAETDRRAM